MTKSTRSTRGESGGHGGSGASTAGKPHRVLSQCIKRRVIWEKEGYVLPVAVAKPLRHRVIKDDEEDDFGLQLNKKEVKAGEYAGGRKGKKTMEPSGGVGGKKEKVAIKKRNEASKEEDSSNHKDPPPSAKDGVKKKQMMIPEKKQFRVEGSASGPVGKHAGRGGANHDTTANGTTTKRFRQGLGVQSSWRDFARRDRKKDMSIGAAAGRDNQFSESVRSSSHPMECYTGHSAKVSGSVRHPFDGRGENGGISSGCRDRGFDEMRRRCSGSTEKGEMCRHAYYASREDDRDPSSRRSRYQKFVEKTYSRKQSRSRSPRNSHKGGNGHRSSGRSRGRRSSSRSISRGRRSHDYSRRANRQQSVELDQSRGYWQSRGLKARQGPACRTGKAETFKITRGGTPHSPLCAREGSDFRRDDKAQNHNGDSVVCAREGLARAAVASTARTAATETADRERDHELSKKLRGRISSISTLREAKALLSKTTEYDPVDKMGSMLKSPTGRYDFRLRDKGERILPEPRVAMLMEELPKGTEKPLEWWGVLGNPTPQHENVQEHGHTFPPPPHPPPPSPTFQPLSYGFPPPPPTPQLASLSYPTAQVGGMPGFWIYHLGVWQPPLPPPLPPQ